MPVPLRFFDAHVHFWDPAVQIDGVVHVTAARGPGNYLAETAHLAELHQAEGVPTALVGGFNPDAPLAVIEAEPDEQALVPLFAGVRTMERWTFPVDGLFGSFAEMIESYDAITGPLGPQEQAKLFSDNARAVYTSGLTTGSR